jgi:hypothetical protein
MTGKPSRIQFEPYIGERASGPNNAERLRVAEAWPPNTGLELTIPDAAQSVLRPLCLLRGSQLKPTLGTRE